LPKLLTLKTDVTPVANFGMFWLDQFLTSEVCRLNDICLRVADVYWYVAHMF